MILPDRAYAFFSHTHKAQKENMPLLDKVRIPSFAYVARVLMVEEIFVLSNSL